MTYFCWDTVAMGPIKERRVGSEIIIWGWGHRLHLCMLASVARM